MSDSGVEWLERYYDLLDRGIWDRGPIVSAGNPEYPAEYVTETLI